MTRKTYGEMVACCKCGQDIQWLGKHGWRDRGNNRRCVAMIERGEIVYPKRKNQTHAPSA